MYFRYNGTRDWLKIEWRDQSRMKIEVVDITAKLYRVSELTFLPLIHKTRNCISEFL
jgi:hypothetical protein